MPEAAISGLVEGLLQGHAIRQQKQRDEEEKSRQHAQDIASQHIQMWRESQAKAAAKSQSEQDKEAKRQFDANLLLKQSEITSKETDRKAREDLAKSSLSAKTDKERQDNFVKYVGLGYPPDQATALSGWTPPGMQGAPQSAPQQPGLQNALGILGQAGQGQAPIPGGGIGANGARPDIMSLLQGSPDATGVRPQTRTPGLDPSTIGQSPKIAADIAAKQAATAKAEAAIPKLKADAVYAHAHSEWMKAHTENEKQLKGLTQGKTDLVHAQAAYKKAMIEYDGDLKKADRLLQEARTSEAIARTDYLHEQTQHTKNMDIIKSSSVDLNTETKKANLREKALKEETSFKKDREKQEDALGKMQFSLNAQSRIAAMDKSKIDPNDPKNNAILVQIDTAKANVPYLQQRIAETKDRIDFYTKQEAESHAYVQQTTDMLNKSGTVNKAATEKNRAAADKAAKNPPKLPVIPGPGANAGRLQSKPLPSGGGKHYIYDPKTGQMKEQ